MVWDPEFTQFYSDGYILILGTSKHPRAVGNSGKETWSEISETIGLMWEKILTTGESFAGKNFKLLIERSGELVESYFSYSYSPICDDDGNIAGIFVAASEPTEG